MPAYEKGNVLNCVPSGTRDGDFTSAGNEQFVIRYVPADGQEFLSVIWMAANGNVIKTYDKVYKASLYPYAHMMELEFYSALTNVQTGSPTTKSTLFGSCFVINGYKLTEAE